MIKAVDLSMAVFPSLSGRGARGEVSRSSVGAEAARAEPRCGNLGLGLHLRHGRQPDAPEMPFKSEPACGAKEEDQLNRSGRQQDECGIIYVYTCCQEHMKQDFNGY